LIHRVRLTGQRTALARMPDRAVTRLLAGRPARGSGWPPAFVPLDGHLAAADPSADAEAAAMVDGRFTFLNRTVDLGTPPDWSVPDAPLLWRFHLHYFDWVWSFVSHPDRAWAQAAFAELWRSWRAATRFGQGVAWSPYVASLRAWSLCGTHQALAGGGELDGELADDLARHAGFLRAHLELDVGGNHLVKNLKALCGLGVFLDDDELLASARARLERQLAVQVLDDGGHFERSPSYHCQVLGDLVDVGSLLEASGRPGVVGLDRAVAAMRAWLDTMLMPDGDVPLFNDCTLVGRQRVALLQPAGRPGGRLAVLQPSGYVVMRPGADLHVVADVGPPCPPDLPAHAHADCLSFEMAVAGRRVVVDSGTSTYEPGARRAYERSTAAHNSVDVDGADQTEVWGTFRAARRAIPTLVEAVESETGVEVTAFHDGYHRLPGQPRHRRTWSAADDRLVVTDTVTGAGRHRVRASLHLLTEERARIVADGSVAVGGLTVTCTGPAGTTVESAPVEVATGFGIRTRGLVLTASFDGELPVVLTTTLAPAAPTEGNPP
jgi:uncharacterized heparinase superfamily protein